MTARRITVLAGPGLLGVLVACQLNAEGQGGGNAGLGGSDGGTEAMTTGSSGASVDESGESLPDARRRRLDVAAAHAGTAEDATVLVVLDDSRIEYALTQPDGADLRFFAADETTRLPAQIEHWDPNGTSTVWVHVSTDTVPDHLWMYYGDGEGFEPSAADKVWGAGFEAVWHMGDEGDGQVMPDASGRGHDLSLAEFNGALDVPGAFGRGAHFDPSQGSEGPMALPSGDALALTEAITIEAWISVAEGEPDGDRFAVFKAGSYTLSTMSVAPASTRPAVTVRTAADAPSVAASGSLGSDWTYVVATYSAEQGTLLIARNGTIEMSENIEAAVEERELAISDQPLTLGHRLEGVLDEVRISSIARSSAWIGLQHASMTDTLLSFGPPQARPN